LGTLVLRRDDDREGRVRRRTRERTSGGGQPPTAGKSVRRDWTKAVLKSVSDTGGSVLRGQGYSPAGRVVNESSRTQNCGARET